MKHLWEELLPPSNYPYPSYVCSKCGRFASNYPTAQGSFDIECTPTVTKKEGNG